MFSQLSGTESPRDPRHHPAGGTSVRAYEGAAAKVAWIYDQVPVPGSHRCPAAVPVTAGSAKSAAEATKSWKMLREAVAELLFR
jgi:hypothetical protein